MGKLYVVQRVHQRGSPMGIPIISTPDREWADAFRDECVKQWRATVNPCENRYGIHYLTSMEPELLYDWISDLGLVPPEVERMRGYAMGEWWRSMYPRMTEYQRAKIWQVLDRVGTYEVFEIEWDD